MSELARQLIEREKRERTGYLNLGYCGLTKMPDLSELEGLETLILSDRYWDWEQKKMVTAQNMGAPNHIRALAANLLPLRLKKTVLSNLGLSDAPFLAKLTNLTSLDLSYNRISNLSFISKLTCLTSLNLRNNSISNASSLAKLTNLTFINLSDNRISDWSFLENLTNLTSLALRSNRISDASFVTNLTSLTSLDLNFNQISNVSFVEKLTSLTSLYLVYNKIKDASFLANLTSLTSLGLSSNQISDWSFLEKLTSLTSLDLNSIHISDWSFLEKLTSLTSLILSFNQISDASFLAKLTKLNSLKLSYNRISDASFLANLTSLTSLDLSSNQISDASFLEKLTSLTSLGLSFSQISDWSFLEKLASLTSLNLSSNQISKASFLANLTSLTSLDLSSNQISDWSFLEKLTSLTSLDLSSNQISDASFLAKLTNLTSLDLRLNQISDASFLFKLTKINSLRLTSNKISDISFLTKLTNLFFVDLSYNRIIETNILTKLSDKIFIDLSFNQISNYGFLYDVKEADNISLFPIQPSELSEEDYKSISKLFPKNLEQLQELNNKFIVADYYNFFESVDNFEKIVKDQIDKGQETATLFDEKIPGILIRTDNITDPPPSVIQQGHKAILEYFRQKEKTGAAPLLEAKLILLGDGRAGKTSLANRLLNKPLPQEADRTRGVEIIIGEYGFPTANGPFKLHIWDFAGQDKYKPLHQFFYTEDAVYVMVADSGNAQTDFDDWLQTAELFGTGSPLLVVLNEFREGIGYGIFDAEHWKKRFPHLLKEVHLANLLTGQGLDVIQKDIRHFAEKLPHTQQAYPKNWAAIREELERRRDENFISFAEYQKICRDHDLPTKESALILSGVLHKIGVCLHYQQSDLLRQYVILKNEWATQAVYKILEDQQVAEVKKGFFDSEDLRRVWSEEAYCEMRPQLLALMQQFRMAYPLPNSQEYVTPPLLPPAPPPGWEFPGGEALELYVEYELLPKALLTQFIVVRHTDIDSGRTLVWRNGVVLRWSADTLAEVVKTKSQGRDAFYVRARGGNRKGLLTSLLKTLRDLHKEYKGIKFAELVPCPCRGCREKRNKQHYFDFDNLRNRLERGRRVVECDKSLEEIELVKLLGDLLVFDVLAAGQPVVLKDVKNDTPPPAPRVPLAFFSYSKHDAAFLTEFQKHLRPLERTHKIRLWDDRKIRPGEAWDAEIKEALATADIIFLLMSPDFLDTNYIVETELAGAMARHESGEAKIIPVKIRPCAWEDTPLGELQGLPRKDKFISTAADRDTAWLEVLAEIKREIRHWQLPT